MRIIPIRGVNTLLLTKPKFGDVISVCREGDLPISTLCRRHAHVNCDDVFDEDMHRLALEAQQHGRLSIPPNEGHIVQAVRFSRESDLDRLLIHCAMGHSRNPAIAWCILYDRLQNEQLAWDELRRIRPEVVPNARIIRIGPDLIPTLPKAFPPE